LIEDLAAKKKKEKKKKKKGEKKSGIYNEKKNHLRGLADGFTPQFFAIKHKVR